MILTVLLSRVRFAGRDDALTMQLPAPVLPGSFHAMQAVPPEEWDRLARLYLADGEPPQGPVEVLIRA